MDRTQKLEFREKTYYLSYDMEVFFEVDEKFGGYSEMQTAIIRKNRQGLDDLRWLTEKLAERGELLRREQGFDHGEMLSIEGGIFPAEYFDLLHAVIETCTLGIKQDDSKKKKPKK